MHGGVSRSRLRLIGSDYGILRYGGTRYFLFNCRNLPMYNSYVKVAGETTPIGGKHREPLLHESCFQKKILCLLNSTQLYSGHT